MIDARTELYGIIGNPVKHSLSPVIHNGAFRRMGLNAVYLAFEVKNLRETLRGMRGLGIRGLSVTLPFKTQILPLLDRIEDLAERVGAVNTIANERGKLVGYNTDCQGAMEALEEKVDLKGKKVILLGAGGAARAIGFGLKERGCQIIILNRSPERAAQLAKELGCIYHPLSPVNHLEADVVINATSIGMDPHGAESPLSEKVLRKGMTVMDIVYRPPRTKLLQDAVACGCQTIDGLEMLARQGAAQFEIWTGRRPGIREIQEDLLRALEEESLSSFPQLRNEKVRETLGGCDD